MLHGGTAGGRKLDFFDDLSSGCPPAPPDGTATQATQQRQTAPNATTDDDSYVLRARIAQELRRIIDKVVLNSDREIRLVFKPASGYRAQMEFRNGRFEMLKLIDTNTSGVTEIPRILFLETQWYMFSST
jgi:hypothetical protein